MQKTKKLFQSIKNLKNEFIEEFKRMKNQKKRGEIQTIFWLSIIFIIATRPYGIFIPFIVLFASFIKSWVFDKIYFPELVYDKVRNLWVFIKAGYAFIGSMLLVEGGYYAFTLLTLLIFYCWDNYQFKKEGNKKVWAILTISSIALTFLVVASGWNLAIAQLAVSE